MESLAHEEDGKGLSCLGQPKNGGYRTIELTSANQQRESRRQLRWAGLPRWPGKMAQREQKGTQQLVYFIYGNCAGLNKVAYIYISCVRRLSLHNCKGESKLKGN